MTAQFIQNVSMSAVEKGLHIAPGPNAMLIQIVDPGMSFPTSLYPFKEVHQFAFLDAEESDNVPEEHKCSEHQAEQIVALLHHALANRMQVIVHCVAGVCRSGAVCEVGVMLGFSDTEMFRSPNILVKHRLMRAAGLVPNENEYEAIFGKLLSSS